MAEKGKTAKDSFADMVKDLGVDVWKLLSETGNYLSRTPEFVHYETQLRDWRTILQSKAKDPEAVRTVRKEVTELRKQLRLQGHDLSIAGQTLKFDGFRNDACVREGFRRLVFAYTLTGTAIISGEANHVELYERLEAELSNARERMGETHYLWFKRNGNEVILSGSDTEGKENFDRFTKRGEANPLPILKRLKGMR